VTRIIAAEAAQRQSQKGMLELFLARRGYDPPVLGKEPEHTRVQLSDVTKLKQSLPQ